jgi:hypothetical protein
MFANLGEEAPASPLAGDDESFMSAQIDPYSGGPAL